MYPEVSLVLATNMDAPLLANLLELYIHDLSDVFPQVVLGTDGRFGYPRLAEYGHAADRHAYVIQCDTRVAGCVLVTGTSTTGYDVAEFFVLKQYRGTGVARRAAQTLWTTLPGSWTVRVSVRNVRAFAFWAGAIAASLGRSVHPETTGDWHRFRFTLATPR